MAALGLAALPVMRSSTQQQQSNYQQQQQGQQQMMSLNQQMQQPPQQQQLVLQPNPAAVPQPLDANLITIKLSTLAGERFKVCGRPTRHLGDAIGWHRKTRANLTLATA